MQSRFRPCGSRLFAGEPMFDRCQTFGYLPEIVDDHRVGKRRVDPNRRVGGADALDDLGVVVFRLLERVSGHG